jgi:iron complex outermembrane receptor protein
MELTDPWQAQNIQDVTTKVLKHNCFIALILMHLLKSYNLVILIQNDIKESTFAFSQYSLNSLKHQFVGLQYAILENFTNTISYRYAERIAGDSYSVVDLGASYTLHAFELSLFANNIFNTGIQKRI